MTGHPYELMRKFDREWYFPPVSEGFDFAADELRKNARKVSAVKVGKFVRDPAPGKSIDMLDVKSGE